MRPLCQLLATSFLLLCIAFPISAQEQAADTTTHKSAGLTLLNAVEHTLRSNPIIRFDAQSLRQQKGIYQQSRGQFDLHSQLNLEFKEDHQPLTSTQQQTVGEDSIRSQTSGYFAGLSKTFRGGQQASLGVLVERTEDRITNPTRPNQGELKFTVVQPLLQNNGYEAIGAVERQARLLMLSQQYELKRSITKAVFSTTTAFWGYRAAHEILKIRKDTEDRSRQRHKDMLALVKADERPATVLTQSEADLASRRADRIAAELNLYRSKQALGIAMGISFTEISNLPPSRDDFPQHQTSDKVDLLITDALIESVLKYRNDYLSVEKQLEAASAILAGAKNGRLPKVDLQLEAGYRGLSEGGGGSDYFSALEDNAEGANVRVALNYAFPFANNAANGLVLQAKAGVEQRRISYHELRRQIVSDLSIALSDLLGSISTYQAAEIATTSFKKSLQSEMKKFRLGMSTLLDVQQVEEQLTQALLRRVQAALSYANSIAQVRLESETLIDFSGDTPSITSEDLASVPSLILTGR